MLEKLTVLALPLIALFMLFLMIFALWPDRKPSAKSGSGGLPARDRAAPRRGATRR